LTEFDDIVREVKDQVDIVTVVSRYVSLKKRGKNYIGLCPFHSEKTPSFTVSPDKDFYHCFGCGKGGDVLGFVMEMEGIDFPGALKTLAEEVGVKIPERSFQRTRRSPYEDLYEINRVAMEFYHRTLMESEEGAGALAYLEERGIDRETIKSFDIGYALDGWDSLIKHVQKKGLQTELLIRSGLAVKKREGEYDYFRQRILFPIKDNRGRLAGFAGREFGGTSPKYLNSPDTPVFTKRKILYGYHSARSQIRSTGEVLIVEGYTDLITLFQHGRTNVVAPMGTALTEYQATLLSRVARTAILVYDRDKAGLKATFRAGDIFLKKGIGVKVVQLPEGEDPDSFVLRKGIKSFDKEIKNAQDVFDLKILILKEKGMFGSVDDKRISADHLLKTLEVTKDEVIRDIYLGKASDSLGIDRRVLENRLEDVKVTQRVKRKGLEEIEKSGLQKIEGFVERYLIQMMLMGDEFVNRLIESLTSEDFTNPLLEFR
jgi:DNA primase